MTKHDKHLILLAGLVVLGILSAWLRISEAHDVALLALGGLLVEVQVRED